MKKILITLTIPLLLMAQSFLISNVALPNTSIQNLDPYPCDGDCLMELIDNEQIFSFLAHTEDVMEDMKIEQLRKQYLSELQMKEIISNTKLKIALLLPYKKIGRYAASTTNASFAYLISKNRPFELKSYNIEYENIEEISKALEQIEDDGFTYVIAPLTQMGENIVSSLNPDINIFFPTVNKKDSTSTSPYLYYGGIDYRAQSDLLLKEASSPLVIFYDKSAIGNSLSSYQEEQFKKTEDTNNSLFQNKYMYDQPIEKSVVKFQIPKRTTNLEKQLKENENINEGSFFVNTPIIKSGMIISQLTLYDTNATNVLSTQTNYNPLILSMTQYHDRKNMLIANSITQHKDVIIETNSLLGNDIVYDWINYTTTIGIDYFFSELKGEQRDYDIKLVDNQMIYDIQLIKPSVSRFITYSQ